MDKTGIFRSEYFAEGMQTDEIVKIGKEMHINFLPSVFSASYSPVSPGWDVSKHPNAVTVPNWSNGYNGGVQSPAEGYHAMWNIIDGIPTIVFQNHNSVIGKTGRWMGVVSANLSRVLDAGTKYTISYEQKTIDTLGGYTTCGKYYKLSSSGSQSFHDGCPTIGRNTVLNKWQRFSHTFTSSSSATSTQTVGTIYVYGNYGTESTMYVRNVKMELADSASPYIESYWDDSVRNGWVSGNNVYEY